MAKKTVFAIKDTHSETNGRNKAREGLESGRINIFFIEWPNPVNIADVPTSFTGLNQKDVEPNLITLTNLAISRGIEVVSCDLSVEATQAALDAKDPDRAPYNALSAFQPWGQAVRDEHAVGVITTSMRNHANSECIGLVMFGSNHFVENPDRGVDPLHTLLKASLNGYGIDFYLLK